MIVTNVPELAVPAEKSAKKRLDPIAQTLLAGVVPSGYKVCWNPNEPFLGLRIRTPFAMPDTEQIYVYIELLDSRTGAIRLTDDGVVADWLGYYNLYWTFRRNLRKLKKACMAPFGVEFKNRGRGERILMTTGTIAEAFAHVDKVAKSMIALALGSHYTQNPQTQAAAA